jgi:hypothetical protein
MSPVTFERLHQIDSRPYSCRIHGPRLLEMDDEHGRAIKVLTDAKVFSAGWQNGSILPLEGSRRLYVAQGIRYTVLQRDPLYAAVSLDRYQTTLALGPTYIIGSGLSTQPGLRFEDKGSFTLVRNDFIEATVDNKTGLIQHMESRRNRFRGPGWTIDIRYPSPGVILSTATLRRRTIVTKVTDFKWGMPPRQELEGDWLQPGKIVDFGRGRTLSYAEIIAGNHGQKDVSMETLLKLLGHKAHLASVARLSELNRDEKAPVTGSYLNFASLEIGAGLLLCTLLGLYFVNRRPRILR